MSCKNLKFLLKHFGHVTRSTSINASKFGLIFFLLTKKFEWSNFAPTDKKKIFLTKCFCFISHYCFIRSLYFYKYSFLLCEKRKSNKFVILDITHNQFHIFLYESLLEDGLWRNSHQFYKILVYLHPPKLTHW